MNQTELSELASLLVVVKDARARIVLGNGKKLFGYGAKPAAFTLVDNKVTTTGGSPATSARAPW